MVPVREEGVGVEQLLEEGEWVEGEGQGEEEEDSVKDEVLFRRHILQKSTHRTSL